MLSFVILFFLLPLYKAQAIKGNAYTFLRSSYANQSKNDSTALPMVARYIALAKYEGRYDRLVQGYQDALLFSPRSSRKLAYADSAIVAAQSSGSPSLLCSTYLGRGIVYYFYYRKYNRALEDYLKAQIYSHKTSDLYLRHKVLYHIGVVKSYLGYYEDAKDLFKESIQYFEHEKAKSQDINLTYNMARGYYNSLHQLIVINRYLHKKATSDSLLACAFSDSLQLAAFPLEVAYFRKCRGISKYYDGRYSKSLEDFDKALPEIIKHQDFAWAAVIYHFIGLNHWKHGAYATSYPYFSKVDSIFEEHQFILPELRANYDYLLKLSRGANGGKDFVYYLGQKQKMDSIILTEHLGVAQRMHQEYDELKYKEAKEGLEKANAYRKVQIMVVISVVVLLLVFLIFYYRRQRRLLARYKQLQVRLEQEQQDQDYDQDKPIPRLKKTSLRPELYDMLKHKIKLFEQGKSYTKKGMNLTMLAKQLKTNTNYLSIFIHEEKNMRADRYLSQLRIEYITKKMNEDPNFLKMRIDALAEECGMQSRQNFCKTFYDYQGIEVTEYIRLRKQELKSNESSE